MVFLPEKFGNWTLFTLQGYLTPTVHPLNPGFDTRDPNITFLKPWNLIQKKPGEVDFVNNYSTVIGIGDIRGLKKKGIPQVVLDGKTVLFINQAFDAISTAVRNAKKLAEGLSDVTIMGERTPVWVAATLLNMGYFTTDNRGSRYFNMSLEDAVEALQESPFEEIALLHYYRKPNIREWLQSFKNIRQNFPERYSLDGVSAILNGDVKPEDAHDFMGIPDSWLDELLED